MLKYTLILLVVVFAPSVQAEIFFDTSFETCATGTGNDFPCEGWNDVGQEAAGILEVSTEQSFSGTKSLKETWTSALQDSPQPSIYNTLVTPQTHLFVRFAHKRMPGWQQAANGNTKLFIIGNIGYPRTIIGDSFGAYAIHMECPYNVTNASGAKVSVNVLGTGVTPSIAPGTNGWDQLEIEILLNTPGQANGLIRFWINGTLRVEQLNKEYRGPTPTSYGPCTNLPTSSDYLLRTIQIYKQVGVGVRYTDRIAAGNTRIGLINGTPPPPDTQAPTVPTNLGAQAVSSSQINLTWSASTDNVGVSGYRIYRSGAQIGTATGTTYSSTGLGASTAYSYTVSAYDAAGNESAKSAAVGDTTSGSANVPPMGTVSNLSATASGANSVTLSFTEVTDGAGQPAKYDVRFSSSGALWGGAPGVAQGTCATPLAGTTVGATKTCTVLGLSPSTAYQFQLIPFRGTMGAGAVYGSLSNVAGATTSSAANFMPPAKPRNLRAQ